MLPGLFMSGLHTGSAAGQSCQSCLFACLPVCLICVARVAFLTTLPCSRRLRCDHHQSQHRERPTFVAGPLNGLQAQRKRPRRIAGAYSISVRYC